MCQYGKEYGPKNAPRSPKIGANVPQFDHPLEQVYISNKNNKKTIKTTFLTLVGAADWQQKTTMASKQDKQVTLYLSDQSRSCIFTMFYAHYPKKLPAQFKQQRNQHRQKKSITATKPSTRSHGPNHLKHTPTRSLKRAPTSKRANMEKDMPQECVQNTSTRSLKRAP